MVSSCVKCVQSDNKCNKQSDCLLSIEGKLSFKCDCCKTIQPQSLYSMSLGRDNDIQAFLDCGEDKYVKYKKIPPNTTELKHICCVCSTNFNYEVIEKKVQTGGYREYNLNCSICNTFIANKLGVDCLNDTDPNKPIFCKECIVESYCGENAGSCPCGDDCLDCKTCNEIGCGPYCSENLENSDYQLIDYGYCEVCFCSSDYSKCAECLNAMEDCLLCVRCECNISTSQTDLEEYHALINNHQNFLTPEQMKDIYTKPRCRYCLKDYFVDNDLEDCYECYDVFDKNEEYYSTDDNGNYYCEHCANNYNECISCRDNLHINYDYNEFGLAIQEHNGDVYCNDCSEEVFNSNPEFIVPIPNGFTDYDGKCSICFTNNAIDFQCGDCKLLGIKETKKLNFYKRRLISHLNHKLTISPCKDSEAECAICLGDNTDPLITRNKCGHHFNHTCNHKWSLLNETCPMCRS